MYLDVKVRLSNKFWARHFVDTVAIWLKCNGTPPFQMDSWQTGSFHALLVRGINVAAAKQRSTAPSKPVIYAD
jgi:hypothetical protein